MRSSFVLILSTIALTALAPACKKKDKEAPPTPAPATAPTPSGSATAPAPDKPAGTALTDPQIAAIVVAANQVDIDAGQLALARSKNDEVKKFAQQMVTDHGAVNQAAVALVTKLGVTPEASDASRGLTSGGADSRATLEKLDGEAFDKAYVDNEVAYHKAVIGVLDSQLIPSATNPELKSTLVGVKPAFDAHLQHAEHLQASLAGTAAAGSAHGM
jgi:putative membrane protein